MYRAPLLDVEKATQAIYERYSPKLERLESDEDVRFENANILREFTKIAVEMLIGEEAINVPGSTPVPMDKTLAKTAALLFAEGVCFSISRFKAKNITGNTKTFILQQTAMNIYNHSKVLALNTDMDKAAVREALFKEINKELKNAVQEYEKQNGPIPGRKVEARS